MALTRRRLAQSTVLTLVLAAHLVFLFLSGLRGQPEPTAPEPEALVLLVLPPRVEEPPQPPPPSRRTVQPRRTPAPARPQLSPPSVTAPVPDLSSPAPPAIDWQREAQNVAREQAAAGIRRQQQACEEARQHGKYPPGCPRASYDPHWQPEEKKAGFAGIIPYVRLGKRCIVGLGFFGCKLDAELPPADGTLMKDMPDPSRPASSVPSLDPLAPEAPKPQAFKPQ